MSSQEMIEEKNCHNMRNATKTREAVWGVCLSFPISPLFEPILFHLIEQVCLAAAQVDNLWTPISVLLLKQIQ